MKSLFFTLLTLALLSVSHVTWADDIFILKFQNKNKWLTQSDKQPLLTLREELVAKDKNKINVVLPVSDRELNLERLYILTEILGRKVKNIIVKEVSLDSPISDNIIQINIPD